MGKTRPLTVGEPIWGHSASDGEKPKALFATWHRIRWLFKLEEPIRPFVHVLPPRSRLSKNHTHSYCHSPRDSILQVFPSIQSQLFLVPSKPIFSSLGLRQKSTARAIPPRSSFLQPPDPPLSPLSSEKSSCHPCWKPARSHLEGKPEIQRTEEGQRQSTAMPRKCNLQDRDCGNQFLLFSLQCPLAGPIPSNPQG